MQLLIGVICLKLIVIVDCPGGSHSIAQFWDGGIGMLLRGWHVAECFRLEVSLLPQVQLFLP